MNAAAEKFLHIVYARLVILSRDLYRDAASFNKIVSSFRRQSVDTTTKHVNPDLKLYLNYFYLYITRL